MTEANEEQNTDEVDVKNEQVEQVITYNLSVTKDLVALLETKDENLIKKEISVHLNKMIITAKLGHYHTIILYDKYNTISKFHSDRIYNSISNLDKKKDILLILLSDGGKIEPAYLISKTCKRLCKDKFIVSIRAIASKL